MKVPGKEFNGIRKSLSINSDFGGCGFYRMLWPNTVLNTVRSKRSSDGPGFQAETISSIPVESSYFYNQFNTVRLQRSASKQHMDLLRDF